MLRLRPATLADVPLLRRWAEQPHVVEAGVEDWDWEGEVASTDPCQEPLIAELDGRPLGFLALADPAAEPTHYWGDCEPHLRALDIWIGDAEDLGRGHGTELMHLALERCFATKEVRAVVLDPLASNVRARRFYERLGFRHLGDRQFGSDHCAVYRLDRADWRPPPR